MLQLTVIDRNYFSVKVALTICPKALQGRPASSAAANPGNMAASILIPIRTHMNDMRDLAALIRSRTPIIVIETMEERRALKLLEDFAHNKGQALYRWSAAAGLSLLNFRYGGRDTGGRRDNGLTLVDDYQVESERSGGAKRDIDDTQPLPAALQHIDQSGQAGLYVLLDVHHYFEDPVVLRLLREIALEHAVDNRTLVLVSPSLTLPPKLARHAAHVHLSLPDEARIRELLETEFALYERAGGRIRRDAQMDDAMVRYASGLCEEDVRQLLRQSIRDDGALTARDLQRAARAKQQTMPGLTLEAALEGTDAIGGLTRLRRWLAQRRPIFLGDVSRPGLPTPKGVLIMGVQGCGKSLAAKTTAAAWGLPLLRLDIGALYDKFQGETERKLRDALNAAEGMQPVVMWIDEIEKGLAVDGGNSDGGVSRRVLGTLLTWMAERSARIFIVATANDVQALPPELIRKGRFDEMFFVDLPDAPARETIFRIQLARHKLDSAGFDLKALALRTEGMSGAEIEQAVVSALYETLPDGRSPDMGTLLAEIGRTRPLSVLMAEKITALRAWATERCVMAD
jgi:SpoVK/Ycf46/Vps4 family AAA+-type ATPase